MRVCAVTNAWRLSERDVLREIETYLDGGGVSIKRASGVQREQFDIALS
ncbi:MAG: hypothetical protein HYR56_03745 [Acidobacteria bacterium]|nr:hypothetical protein [Acidobacteriota bacterium]MBI3426845.1 hypothetical protein [Acidobacteriota bacterium]